MISLILAFNMCLPATFINRTEFAWNKFDQQTFLRATKRCGELFENTPCVKQFIKTGKIDYQVVCSEYRKDVK